MRTNPMGARTMPDFVSHALISPINQAHGAGVRISVKKPSRRVGPVHRWNPNGESAADAQVICTMSVYVTLPQLGGTMCCNADQNFISVPTGDTDGDTSV